MAKATLKNKGDRPSSLDKGIDYYMSLPYPIEVQLINDESGSYYFAKVPDLPGCHTDGPTAAEAVAELEIVKRDYLEVKLEIGADIPEPGALPSGTTNVRMPRTLHGQLIKDAEREKVSLNALIVYRLTQQTKEQSGVYK
ncbi:type II toxin-antitoxin system HicB family antitoxin [Paenibacillus jamilae]|uniref:type II toxin-antitoxin system HicB family antitoxin n=1 Tax=Paenibacillus jamilae TaxID=114136 RepID=UPI000ADC40AF|nr:type II toxin-antitoxin system HicB family antitoxin [Paenibacillus jamilae]